MSLILYLWIGHLPTGMMGPMPSYQGANGVQVYYAGPSARLDATADPGLSVVINGKPAPRRLKPPAQFRNDSGDSP